MGREELAAAIRLADETVSAWAKRERTEVDERRAYVESAALKLHNFYTACERIFERIAKVLDGTLPEAPDSHVQLLRTMSSDVPGVRPSVITPALAERLSEFLRFRHVVRNLYGFQLREEKMGPLVAKVVEVAQELEAQVTAFLDDLETLSGMLEG